jgi:hypothetical protein
LQRFQSSKIFSFALMLCLVASPSGALQQDSKVATTPPQEPSKPVTAGGFVDGAPIVYEDVTKKTGIGSFVHRSGTPEKNYILEVPGSGVALLDYDNDGWLDIYLVNGSTFEALDGKEKAPRAALFHNNHDGTFTDVTAKAGVANERWGFGVAVGDFDNDGWPDIYVSNFGKNRLYRNNHDGTFTDVAEKAGVTLGGWSTGVTFGDYDGDGKLDLFVAGYVQFDTKNLPKPGSDAGSYSFCQYRGQNVMCGPRGLRGEHDHLFHNNGDGTFTDVSEKAGVSDPNGYYGFSAAFADINDDGRLDLLVANDSTPNYLYLNKGDGTFEDASYASGFAVNENGREQAAMGLAIGDYNNDGKLDLQTTNFSDDYNTIYKNEGEGGFTDVSFAAGVGETTVPYLGWGTAFIDFENSGFKGIFAANGHVYPAVDKNDWGTTFAQRPLLFRNVDGEKFKLVPAATGSGLAEVLKSRGAAFGDLFNRGQIDIVLNNLDSPPTLLRNVGSANNWITLKLVGTGKSPADAIGATVWVTANGITQRQDVISGGSFLSSSDLRPHFGLGSTTKLEKLEIRWPSGKKEMVPVSGLNRIVTIVEGKGEVEGKRESEKPKPARKTTRKK